ncbi:MAG TPA: hypothetical protein VGN72_17100 [Tepidisphaeraceae bacterium]|nr:hypothetical protein [Tepidisphaeraceae bacterium]
MKKDALYSAVASAINFALFILLVVLTTVYIPSLMGLNYWWVYTLVAILSFLAYGYLVQWVLSFGVNTMLLWLFFGRDIEKRK